MHARNELLVHATATIKMSVSDPECTTAGKTGFKGGAKWEFSLGMVTSGVAQTETMIEKARGSQTDLQTDGTPTALPRNAKIARAGPGVARSKKKKKK